MKPAIKFHRFHHSAGSKARPYLLCSWFAFVISTARRRNCPVWVTRRVSKRGKSVCVCWDKGLFCWKIPLFSALSVGRYSSALAEECVELPQRFSGLPGSEIKRKLLVYTIDCGPDPPCQRVGTCVLHVFLPLNINIVGAEIVTQQTHSADYWFLSSELWQSSSSLYGTCWPLMSSGQK